MKLEIDCSWNDQKEVAKVEISFANAPKSLFRMSEDKIRYLKNLEKNCLLEGPKVLNELGEIAKKNSESIYASLVYFQALRSFEFFDEAIDFFGKMKQKFPDQPFTKCIDAHYALEENNLEAFSETFGHHEVLKPAFPKRKIFYYQEAILFHNAWGMYFTLQKDIFQAEKHDKFIGIILNVIQSVSNSLASAAPAV